MNSLSVPSILFLWEPHGKIIWHYPFKIGSISNSTCYRTVSYKMIIWCFEKITSLMWFVVAMRCVGMLAPVVVTNAFKILPISHCRPPLFWAAAWEIGNSPARGPSTQLTSPLGSMYSAHGPFSVAHSSIVSVWKSCEQYFCQKKNVLMPSRNVVNKTFWTFYPNVLAEVVFSVALRKKNASTNRFHRIIHDTSGQVPSRINIETLRCRVLTFLTRIGIWTHGQSVCNYYWPVCLFSMPLHQHIFETVL
jgi:hypothetical protein